MTVSGVLQIAGRSGGHLRRRAAQYLPQSGDVRVDERVIRQYGLRTGDDVNGETRNGKGGPALDLVSTINGRPAAELRDRPEFTSLTAIHPDVPLRLTSDLGPGNPATQVTCPVT